MLQNNFVGSEDSNGSFTLEELRTPDISVIEPVPQPGGKPVDANKYATKKTIAQGFLDIALLTANASQLKYVLTANADEYEFRTLMIVLISISIFLQVVVGVMFIVVGGLNLNKEHHQSAADILNNIITAVLFIITLINIIINGFGMDLSSNLPSPLPASTME